MRIAMAVTAAQSQGDLFRAGADWNRAAEKYTEALRLQRKNFGLGPLEEKLVRAAAECLTSSGRLEEAIKLVNDYSAPGRTQLLLNAETADRLYWRGDKLARQRRWREARDDITLALKCCKDAGVYHGLAALLIADRDTAAYHELCREMCTRFARTNDFLAADRISKDCLILPSSGADLNVIAALADMVVTEGNGHGPYTWFLFDKALADYRQGKFQQAVARTSQILKDPFPYTQADGHAVLAMAQFQLGNTEAARTALSELERVVQKELPPPESHDLGGDWIDWVFTHALLDEARGLIQGPPPVNVDWH